MTSKKRNKYKIIFENYVDLNYSCLIKNYFLSKLTKTDAKYIKDNIKLVPLTLSQFGLIYNLQPNRFDGMVNNDLLKFLSTNFRKNTSIIMTLDGFLDSIMIADTTRGDRILINDYFAFYINDLPKYRYLTTEFDVYYECFKLVNYKLGKDNKNFDVRLIFY